jgi:site-specific DNA-adenine methylase
MAYAGNKREEVEVIYDNINFTNINTIIEPYAGTCAISYYISTKHPKQFTYILNDLNKNMYRLYNILKNKDEIIKFEKEVNDVAKTIINKDTYKDAIKNMNTCPIAWFISNKIYTIRPALYRLNYKYTYIKITDYPVISFFQNEKIIFYNEEGLSIFKKYENDKNAFIILDPPYLLSCNDYYDEAKTQQQNIYEYLHNNDIKKKKAKIAIIVARNWIIDLLFQKFKNKVEYDKIYKCSKKTVKHTIIKNYT